LLRQWLIFFGAWTKSGYRQQPMDGEHGWPATGACQPQYPPRLPHPPSAVCSSSTVSSANSQAKSSDSSKIFFIETHLPLLVKLYIYFSQHVKICQYI
jgi:hypothetical protein